MDSGPGGKVTLPRWLQLLFLAVAEAPWTNIKQLNAITMDWATAMFMAGASLFGYALTEWAVYAWLAFLAGLNGFALAAAGIKRATYKPAPPYGPDIEDAQAGATAEHPAVTPKAGVKPRDPAIVAAVESAAKADPRLPSPLDDERD